MSERDDSTVTTPRVGIEIEFSGLTARAAAEVLCAQLGGVPDELDPHRIAVETPLGRFLVELDMTRAHPSRKSRSPAEADGLLAKLDSGMAEVIGDLGGLWMPQELICPPLKVEHLPAIDALFARLREAGALGSGASAFYAFGLHLNVEETDLSAEPLLAYLRAYAILQDWLAEQTARDRTRRLLRFAAPFPASYLRLILSSGYRPALPRLIADYLLHNPTRNRGLDMLPIFSLLAPAQVAGMVEHRCLSARPTYHYRLPDSRIDETGWGGVMAEWSRWQLVARLARDATLLTKLSTLCLAHLEQPGLLRRPWSETLADHLSLGEGSQQRARAA